MKHKLTIDPDIGEGTASSLCSRTSLTSDLAACVLEPARSAGSVQWPALNLHTCVVAEFGEAGENQVRFLIQLVVSSLQVEMEKELEMQKETTGNPQNHQTTRMKPRGTKGRLGVSGLGFEGFGLRDQGPSGNVGVTSVYSNDE